MTEQTSMPTQDAAQDILPKKEVPELEFTFATKTIPSDEHPERNDDLALELPQKKTFGIFDGLGMGNDPVTKLPLPGAGKGVIAAGVASETVQQEMQLLSDNPSLDEVVTAVQNSLYKAHDAVLAKAASDKDLAEMGTTGTVCNLWEGKDDEKDAAIIGNVGDSRAYLLRNGELLKITFDDSIIRNTIGTEELPDEEAARQLETEFDNVTNKFTELDGPGGFKFELFKNRNAMIQDLGAKKITPRIDIVDIEKSDVILLCSDAIPDNLTAVEIQTILNKSKNPEDAVAKLTQAAQVRSKEFAHSRHKPDDITAIVIFIGKTETKDEPKSNTEQPAELTAEPTQTDQPVTDQVSAAQTPATDVATDASK